MLSQFTFEANYFLDSIFMHGDRMYIQTGVHESCSYMMWKARMCPNGECH